MPYYKELIIHEESIRAIPETINEKLQYIAHKIATGQFKESVNFNVDASEKEVIKYSLNARMSRIKKPLRVLIDYEYDKNNKKVEIQSFRLVDSYAYNNDNDFNHKFIYVNPISFNGYLDPNKNIPSILNKVNTKNVNLPIEAFPGFIDSTQILIKNKDFIFVNELQIAIQRLEDIPGFEYTSKELIRELNQFKTQFNESWSDDSHVIGALKELIFSFEEKLNAQQKTLELHSIFEKELNPQQKTRELHSTKFSEAITKIKTLLSKIREFLLGEKNYSSTNNARFFKQANKIETVSEIGLSNISYSEDKKQKDQQMLNNLRDKLENIKTITNCMISQPSLSAKEATKEQGRESLVDP
ncbi:MAG: hypothetical protein LEGION0398_MBIBDBAK_00669 [Legionellaceae bacterium]